MFMGILVQTVTTTGDICLSYPVVSALVTGIVGAIVYMQKQKDEAVNRLLDRLEKEADRKDE